MEPGCSSLQPTNVVTLSDDENEKSLHYAIEKPGSHEQQVQRAAFPLECRGQPTKRKQSEHGFKTFEVTRRHVLRVLSSGCPCARAKRSTESCFRPFAIDEPRKSELIRMRWKLLNLHKHDADEKAWANIG